MNVVGALLLHTHAHENLNVRGAYLHVLGDLLGSVGAIVAGIVLVTTGWSPVDAIVSVLIAALILVGAARLVRESAPRHLDMDEIQRELASIAGLDRVHDLHVWTLTSGFVALAAHGVIDDPAEHSRILDDIRRRMRGYGIEHVTFQLELRPLYQLPRPRDREGGQDR